MKILTIDIETTGLPAKNSDYKIDFLTFPRIVSLGFKINDDESKEWIINQEGFQIPEEATKLHGITNEMCDASEFKLQDVLPILGLEGSQATVVIGHGIYFDTSIIKANILRLIHDKEMEQDFYDAIEDLLHKDKRVDTMRQSAKLCGKWPKLHELYFKLFKEEFKGHNAKDDCNAAHRCYLELKRLKIINDKPAAVATGT